MKLPLIELRAEVSTEVPPENCMFFLVLRFANANNWLVYERADAQMLKD
jgi:hypothetical protein